MKGHQGRLAFIIPAHNEAGAVGLVVQEILHRFPSAQVVVCDNASTDTTAAEARLAGALVMYESRRGKGMAVRRLMRDVDADVYVMIDGDHTYDMTYVEDAIQAIEKESFDLMTGNRFDCLPYSSMRAGHSVGNALFTLFVKKVCGIQTKDLFSGLRIMSRRFVKSFPMISGEFEVETEISVYAAKMQVPSKDFPTRVSKRMGTVSKLNTFKDGFKILFFVLRLLHREYPLGLYSALSALTALCSSAALLSLVVEFAETGLVPRLPTLVAAFSGLVIALVFLVAGLVLKEIVNLKYEGRMLAYNAIGVDRL